MTDKKQGNYTLQEWVNAGAKNYNVSDEAKLQVKHMLSELVDFCNDHDIPLCAMIGVAEDAERVSVTAFANVPMDRTAGVFLASLHLAQHGLNYETAQDMGAILEADIERNNNTPDRKKPDLKLVH